MAYYNNFFWKKAKEADIVIYNDKTGHCIHCDVDLLSELYSIVAYSIGHPDRDCVECFNLQIHGTKKKIIPIKCLKDESLAIQVAFLLNQFGLKIERYSWNGSIYVVVLK